MNPPSASIRPTNCRIVTLGCHFEYSSYARCVSASACWPPIPGRTHHSNTYFITSTSSLLSPLCGFSGELPSDTRVIRYSISSYRLIRSMWSQRCSPLVTAQAPSAATDNLPRLASHVASYAPRAGQQPKLGVDGLDVAHARSL